MHAKHTRLELCSRDYDNGSVHNPESLKKRGGGNGSETRSGIKSPRAGRCNPKPPSLGGTPALQDGEEVSELNINFIQRTEDNKGVFIGLTSRETQVWSE